VIDIDPSIELRHLRAFVAVAEELHFGRAAERLGMAQPPVSQQIARLEAKLGTKLLTRTSRRVELTDAGRVLLVEARRILAAAREAVVATQRAGRGEAGSISVGFTTSAMLLSLPTIIRRFRGEYPGIHLDLREMSTSGQLAALRAGELDLGFVRQPAPEERVRMEPAMSETLVVAVAGDHRLADRASIAPAELADEDFVLFPRDTAPGLYAQVLAICMEAGFVPRVVQESREIYTTVSLVEAGLGVTITPASIQRMGWGGVAFRPLPFPALTRIELAWHADNRRPAVQSFLGVARAVTREARGR
jgi:LysR family transcriptional regulator, benzoate and cis,cis-muconate-responsive activator of ben and cat genes